MTGIDREINQPDLEEKMSEEQSLTDLESLVLAEIASASSGKGRRNRTERVKRPAEKGTMEESAELYRSSGEIARIHGEDRDEQQMSGEEAELLEQPELIDEPFEELPPNKLFSAEEEAFMHRAVGFLSGRENGDVILGRIWEQLTEAQPDHFFEVPQGVSESQPGSASPERAQEEPSDTPDDKNLGQD
ncbi:MAG: hypothetical protein MI756_18525 [Chromatiales bacterium]|nr:hypothetical protein [Chromatiales bacterium]